MTETQTDSVYRLCWVSHLMLAPLILMRPFMNKGPRIKGTTGTLCILHRMTIVTTEAVVTFSRRAWLLRQGQLKP